MMVPPADDSPKAPKGGVCISCGGSNISDRGTYLWCEDCGYYWEKVRKVGNEGEKVG